jgi:hypothetical protein
MLPTLRLLSIFVLFAVIIKAHKQLMERLVVVSVFERAPQERPKLHGDEAKIGLYQRR